MNLFNMHHRLPSLISTRLQPGVDAGVASSRFNGLSVGRKPLKRFSYFSLANTGLKPGANEKLMPLARIG